MTFNLTVHICIQRMCNHINTIMITTQQTYKCTTSITHSQANKHFLSFKYSKLHHYYNTPNQCKVSTKYL